MTDLHNRPQPEMLSPGLLVGPGDRTPAYELKFLLAEAQAREVERFAAMHLAADPHADPALGNAYHVTSLYLDTPGFDVFHRFPPHHRRKLRLRGYGSSVAVFLEQKTRRGDRVRKRRSSIPSGELERLAQPLALPSWAGAWFQERVVERGLRPAFQISCLRTAFLGHGAEGPMRLTLDRQLRGLPNPDWRLLAGSGGLPLLAGQLVLELKYRTAMPSLFKRLIEQMGLSPGPVSKYRLAVRTWNPTGTIPQVG